MVRIPHPKIEELVLQAQGVGIFICNEIPVFNLAIFGSPVKTLLVFVMLFKKKAPHVRCFFTSFAVQLCNILK
jgi:hypothetical protein